MPEAALRKMAACLFLSKAARTAEFNVSLHEARAASSPSESEPHVLIKGDGRPHAGIIICSAVMMHWETQFETVPAREEASRAATVSMCEFRCDL
jgi:hypothetical protein